MASNRTSVPPSVGARSIDANNIPGTRTSSPYSARPETIAGPSTRFIGFPSSVNADGFFSVGRVGTGCCPAAPASRP